ncbi:hypothetical protein LTR27_005649 [Elasticomyces elasticus]|nr:hypothetical protein LTR27_005649 [Elasticomyces elasticus]
MAAKYLWIPARNGERLLLDRKDAAHSQNVVGTVHRHLQNGDGSRFRGDAGMICTRHNIIACISRTSHNKHGHGTYFGKDVLLLTLRSGYAMQLTSLDGRAGFLSIISEQDDNLEAALRSPPNQDAIERRFRLSA